MRLIALVSALFLFYMNQAHANNLPCSQAAMNYASSNARRYNNVGRTMIRQGYEVDYNQYYFEVSVEIGLYTYQTYAVELRHQPEQRSCDLLSIGITSIAY